jgi:hypothetical protein
VKRRLVEAGGRSLCRTASRRRQRGGRPWWPRDEALQEDGGGAPVESTARRAAAHCHSRLVLEIFFSASLARSCDPLSALPTPRFGNAFSVASRHLFLDGLIEIGVRFFSSNLICYGALVLLFPFLYLRSVLTEDYHVLLFLLCREEGN